jgi:hypothetical protein
MIATRPKPASLDCGAANPFVALDAGWRPLLPSPGREHARTLGAAGAAPRATGVGGTHTGRMSDAPTVGREAFVKEFRERMQGKLPDDKIDAAAEAMTAATTSYVAIMVPITVLVYTRVQVLIHDSKAPTSPQFGGNAGGLIIPPLPPYFGGYIGAVFTDNFARLCTQVGRPFEFHVTPVYSGVTFWDNNHVFIRHFEGGGLGSPSVGGGGGTGSWSHCPT